MSTACLAIVPRLFLRHPRRHMFLVVKITLGGGARSVF